MSVTGDYGRPAGAQEERALGAVLSETFGFPLETAPGWFDSAGREHLRVLRDGGQVAAGLILIPMGQYWGGRSVRMCGVGGVGTAPHLRGGGRATRLMTHALLDMRAQGFALSGLYPATQPLYRRVGYEHAGTRFRFRAAPAALTGGDRSLPARPFTPGDLPAAKALYAQLAQGRDGWLDRGPYVWHRVQNPRGHTVHGYLFGNEGAPEAYLLLARVPTPEGFTNVLVTDLAARTPAGWRRLQAFLADHASLTREVTWCGGADEPLLALPHEQDPIRTEAHLTFMLRVLDVHGALTARGYPAALTARLDLEVADPLLPGNEGRWRLDVSGGTARVERGGQGHLRCDARALATLYSGFRSATGLSSIGALSGTPEALATADMLFCGRPPSMRDMF